MIISIRDTCTFCEQNTESLIHLFWDCKFVQTFWQNIQHWLIQHQIKPQDFSLTLPTRLGLADSTEDILVHHTLVIGRYHIYSSKIKKTFPNLQVLIKSKSKGKSREISYLIYIYTNEYFFPTFLMAFSNKFPLLH